MPLFGPPDVEKLKAKGNVKGLIKALGYEKSVVVRQDAAKALGQIGDARAVEPLIVTLDAWKGDVRRAAAEALGQIGDARAVEPLISALKDGDSATVGALVKIGTPAVEPLIVALKDGHYDVRSAAAEALGQIGDARAVEPLVSALKDGDSATVGALVKIGTPAVEPLIVALKKGHYDVCRAAAEALGQIGDARAVESLFSALKGWDKDVRHDAARALGQIGDARAEVPLVTALKDKEPYVHQAAAIALDKLGWQPDGSEVGAAYWITKREWGKCVKIGTPAVEPLIVALKKGHYDVRSASAEALGEIGDTRAVEPLISALKDKNSDVRSAAAGALVKIGTPAVEPLIATLKTKGRESYRGRKVAAEVLGQIGDTRAVEPLIVVLKDTDKDLRQVAAEALGQIGDARAVEPLIATLEAKDEGVRKVAAEALDKLDWQPDKSEAGAAYWIAKREWSKCIKIGTPSVNPLIAALKDKNEGVRKAAAEALGQTGDARAVEPLIAALMDRRVHQAADEALVQIGDGAVKPLITAALEGYSGNERRVKAKTLVNIYKQGRLSSAHKQLILAQRHRITQHTDKHRDYSTGIGSHHKDHSDEGIGVDFPL